MLVLGIESTCDETGCAVVKDGGEILSNIVSSQIDLHCEYGGVVPELACRRHIDLLIPILDKALQESQCTLKEIDLIAVAHGPGLIGPLLIGLTAAKSLALALGKPFLGINHVEAHLYAAMMNAKHIEFPAVGVIVSGAHTTILLIHSLGHYQPMAQTVDDAIGEAFDKVAKMLHLPYPGGPEIERLAKSGNRKAFPFRAGQVKGHPLDFSFSGLKTAVLYSLKRQNSQPSQLEEPNQETKNDIAASFQHAALSDIVKKTLAIAHQHGCNHVLLGGGVSNNLYLRSLFEEKGQGLHIHWPDSGLSLDNAAMIAGLGYHRYQNKGEGDSFDLQALTRIPF